MGKQIRDLYKEGYDAVGTGNNYPYVLVSPVELEYEVSSQFFLWENKGGTGKIGRAHVWTPVT